MIRVVGTQERSEFVLDPAEAWRRGRAIDLLLAGACVPHERGVFRATHRRFNEIDDLRQVDQARRLNGTVRGSPA